MLAANFQRQQALAEVMKSIEQMSEEEFRVKILKLTGVMTQKCFDKVMQALDKFKHLDAESISYKVKDFGITFEEFEDVYNYLEAYAEQIGVEKEDNTTSFPDYRLYFRYKNISITWRMLIGQGTAQQLFAEDIYDWPPGSAMVFNTQRSIALGPIDDSIKFYKA